MAVDTIARGLALGASAEADDAAASATLARRWASLNDGTDPDGVNFPGLKSALFYALAASTSLTSVTTLAAQAATSATNAHNSELAAAAAVAGVATGAGQYIIGSGPPANSVGFVGATYKDSLTGYLYQKSASGWQQGTIPVYAVVNTWTAYDFRYGATFTTDITITRASPATNLSRLDASGFAYSTFANNVPITHPVRGFGIFQQSRNYLLNSTAPVTQAVSLPVGTYVLWGNGTGTLTTSAGTATATGYGVLDLNLNSFQTITVTVTGTINVTVAGTCFAFQLETNPSLPTQAICTPLIITAGAAVTRNADIPTNGGALGTLLVNGVGGIIIETSFVETNNFASGRTLLGINGAAALYVPSTTQLTWQDVAFHTAPTTIGTSVWTGRMRSAFAFNSAEANITFAGGSRVPTQAAFTFNNGVAVTSSLMGRATNTVAGLDALNGWIARIETISTRPTTNALYLANNTTPYTGVLLNV